MLSVYRAESGALIQLDSSLRDIERLGSLELFLSQHTDIPQDDVLAFLSNGLRITSSNVRELAGSQDQAIYVFNKHYLDVDYESVLNELHTEASLQPAVEENIPSTPPFRPSLVAPAYLGAAHAHLSSVDNTLASLNAQSRALEVALSSLDLHLLSLTTTFAPISEAASRELQREQSLLVGLNADLELISRVRIHASFVSAAVRKAIEAGDRPRTLGDWVSAVKMRQVGEASRRTHDQLRAEYHELETAITSLAQGAVEVRTDIQTSSGLLEEAHAAAQLAHDLGDTLEERTAQLQSPGDADDTDSVLQELRHKDASIRDQLLQVTHIKNTYTSHLIQTLHHISILNNTLAQIPESLISLQTNLRNVAKGAGGGGAAGFGHIQRLHRMLFAYSATVVELVRRKEFARIFYARAQSVLEVIGKLGAAERKRRLAFRGEVHGQLPFEVRRLGMGGNAQEEDPIPNVELVFSPPMPSEDAADGQLTLGRDDVDALLQMFDELTAFARSFSSGSPEDDNERNLMLHVVSDCRNGVERLVEKMDGMEQEWEKGVERGLLSSSKASIYRHSRRSTSYDDQTYQELTELIRTAQERESSWAEERRSFQAQISQLSEDATNAQEERARADRLERELNHLRQQFESESTARRVTEERHAALSSDFSSQKKELSRALADATSQAQVAESLRTDLNELRTQYNELEKLEDANSKRVHDLLEEQRGILKKMSEAHGRGTDLEVQIKAARKENQDMIGVNEQLRADKKEKEKMLREHERAARDLRAEADGDRAVLEREFFEIRAALEEAERASRDARAEAEIANIDARGLRDELRRLEDELREAGNVERLLREDLRSGRSSQERHEHDLESKTRLVAEILDVALAFRASHIKALSTAQNATAHPARFNSSTLTESVTLPASMRHNIIGQPSSEVPLDIDPSNPEAALEVLRSFDHDIFSEAIAKTGSTIRKWQKQCKEYRERAKGKISFRNFAKGDLALFLPTRNSVSKPWAAFNVSFPHYFLQATGHLAEQLQHREWIVARITSISERVVDSNDPTSNPYGLGDGVKYYMLQVEDWTQPTSSSKRRASSRKVSAGDIQEPIRLNSEDPLPPPPGPPSADVDDSFHALNPSNPHSFPVRSRSNSSPPARPSSLSRLLAQASPEISPQIPEAFETLASTQSPTDFPPIVSPSMGISSSPQTSTQPPNSTPQHLPLVSSPLRPGSRASRGSAGSRFSVGRIPVIGSVSSGSSGALAKASATTAVTDRALVSSPSSPDNPFTSPSTPSPEGSIFEGMSSVVKARRRTSSYHVPRNSSASEVSTESSTTVTAVQPSRPATTASGALASFVSGSWGFGRRKRANVTSSFTGSGHDADPEDTKNLPDNAANRGESASDALKKFQP